MGNAPTPYGERWYVSAFGGGREPDPAGLLGLASQMRDNLAKQINCVQTTKPTDAAPASVTGTTDPGRACSVDGLRVAANKNRTPVATRQSTSGAWPHVWFCDLFLQEPPRVGSPDFGPFAQLAVVQEESLFPSITTVPHTKLDCGGKPTYVLSDDATYLWTDEERAKQGITNAETLHERFVSAVAKQEGCTR
ncbi:hypothetical protein QNO07_07230 [Streptomyces sp. 549]|uniref:hypothetical protein n=1 Tax=Streptomyces sp. 549 TaxID=3049076 RepID=UPI0024C22B60|nr:hypothetical protein [Streptomyces sp. 549]MDK1473216.1 hypothetical protein [Streptomyces sp. 549]